MKIIRILSVLAYMCIAGLSTAQVTLTSFSTTWNFCNADGTLERAWNDHCRCQSVYVKNVSKYGFNSNPSGYPIPGTLSGTYYVSDKGGNVFYYIPASSWGYNQVAEIPLDCSRIFNATSEGLNFNITYMSAPGENITYLAKSRALYLRTRSVTVNAGPDLSLCPGDPVSVTPTGAGSYSWSPALPSVATALWGITTTTYTVTGTGSFTVSPLNPVGTLTCTATDAMNITVNAFPLIAIPRFTLCTGDPLPVISAPNGSYTYSWKKDNVTLPGQTSNTLNTALYGYGNYTYTLTSAAGCSISRTISVNLHSSVYANVNADFMWSVTSSGTNQRTINVTASSTQACQHQFLLYNSNANGDLLSLAISSFWDSSPSYTFANLPTGQYFAVVHKTYCTPCNEEKSHKKIFYETKRAPLESHNDGGLHIFPNPGNGVFTISLQNPMSGKVDVLDVTGKKVSALQLKENVGTYQIDLTGFPRGIYIVNLTSAYGVTSQKVILE